jgi:Zn-dependent protease
MDGSTLQFRVLGFPVEVRGTFWLLVALNVLPSVSEGALPAIGWFLALFGGVLVHELGHAVTSRALGVPVGTIRLYGLGGVVDHAPTTPGRQLLVSLAGPLAGAALGLSCLGLAAVIHAPPRVEAALVEPMLWVTLFYGAVNLLPGLPLDGGHAFQAALTPLLGSAHTARRVTAVLGLVLGLGAAALAFFDPAFQMLGLFLGLMLVSFNWPLVAPERA